MDEHSNAYDHVTFKGSFTLGGVLSAGWMSLLYFYPLIWAWGTAVILAMLFGLFTAKFIFGVHSLWKALALAPVLGSFWIGLFYGIIRAMN